MEEAWRGRRGRGDSLQSSSCLGHLGEMESLEGASAKLVGVFSSDLPLLGQTGHIGGTSSRRLVRLPLCSVRPQTSPCLPSLVRGSCVRAKLLQSDSTLCDPVDCSPPGSSVHGILLARILEWVATSFSRGYFRPRDQTCLLCLLHWVLYHWRHLGSLVHGGSSVKTC